MNDQELAATLAAVSAGTLPTYASPPPDIEPPDAALPLGEALPDPEYDEPAREADDEPWEPTQPHQGGYHLAYIERHEYGTLGKVKEEVDEALDALEQGNKLMVLLELSDVLGAIKGYLLANYGDRVRLADLMVMTRATERAFEVGERT